jgi:phosphopantothenoylcysteine decarboxylase/phosphopantothenate--cysteine ligase
VKPLPKNNGIYRVRGRHVIVGITGGIAAYKIGYLIRDLARSGAEVKVVMTEAGTRFVTPLTFSALSKNPVYTDLWTDDQSRESDIGTRHISLANWADVLVIAPASANTIGKLAYGLSDNLLTAVALATKGPVLLAPTMDAEMYLNSVTQQNIARLKERGYIVIPPAKGELASGLTGPGRLPEVNFILAHIEKILLQSNRDLSRKRILVTAGPTYEAIDPVRFISNRSSGKMGFAIANAAALRGAGVTLIAGPTHLETPRNVKRINIESAREMFESVTDHIKKTDVLIMAAAVSDFRPSRSSGQKIKKGTGKSGLELKLESTEDILAAVGKRKGKVVLVGFALETEGALKSAKEKLRRKNLDLVVLNSYDSKNRVFGSDLNKVVLIDRRGNTEKLPAMLKFDVANRILDKIKTVV